MRYRGSIHFLTIQGGKVEHESQVPEGAFGPKWMKRHRLYIRSDRHPLSTQLVTHFVQLNTEAKCIKIKYTLTPYPLHYTLQRRQSSTILTPLALTLSCCTGTLTGTAA